MFASIGVPPIPPVASADNNAKSESERTKISSVKENNDLMQVVPTPDESRTIAEMTSADRADDAKSVVEQKYEKGKEENENEMRGKQTSAEIQIEKRKQNDEDTPRVSCMRLVFGCLWEENGVIHLSAEYVRLLLYIW